MISKNASFIHEIYDEVKVCSTFQDHFHGKKVIVVLDNASAHSQTAEQGNVHDAVVLICLAPYSPMCRPIDVALALLQTMCLV